MAEICQLFSQWSNLIGKENTAELHFSNYQNEGWVKIDEYDKNYDQYDNRVWFDGACYEIIPLLEDAIENLSGE